MAGQTSKLQQLYTQVQGLRTQYPQKRISVAGHNLAFPGKPIKPRLSICLGGPSFGTQIDIAEEGQSLLVRAKGCSEKEEQVTRSNFDTVLVELRRLASTLTDLNVPSGQEFTEALSAGAATV
jgi:hypothetical protein